MSKHIRFDGFECKFLEYVKPAGCWVCMKYFVDLDDVEDCFRCKYERLRKLEERIEKGELEYVAGRWISTRKSKSIRT